MHKINNFIALLFSLCAIQTSLAQAPLWQIQSGSEKSLAIYSSLVPIELNRIHSWELELKQSDGMAISGALIQVVGGMPLHDHGLPTQPRITAETEPGLYLLEGIRFHMPGQWQMQFTVTIDDQSETLTLDFTL